MCADTAILHCTALHTALPCRTDLLTKVRQVVAAHPKTMKYETRHAADGDYKADIMVGWCAWCVAWLGV
jgi:hypothetical protein